MWAPGWRGWGGCASASWRLIDALVGHGGGVLLVEGRGGALVPGWIGAAEVLGLL